MFVEGTYKDELPIIGYDRRTEKFILSQVCNDNGVKLDNDYWLRQASLFLNASKMFQERGRMQEALDARSFADDIFTCLGMKI